MMRCFTSSQYQQFKRLSIMAKIIIDTKKATATIAFSAKEESLAKLLISFLDPSVVVSPTINDSFLKRLRTKVIKNVVLDLNNPYVKKDTIMALLKADAIIK